MNQPALTALVAVIETNQTNPASSAELMRTYGTANLSTLTGMAYAPGVNSKIADALRTYIQARQEGQQ